MAKEGIKIGGILYPDEEWYRANVLARGFKAVGGREVTIDAAGRTVAESLEHTLPPEDIGTKALTLSAGGKLDQMSLLNLFMKDIAQGTYEEKAGQGLETVFEETGLEPQKTSSQLISGIIDFVTSGAKTETQRQMEQFTDLMKVITTSKENQQMTARANLEVLINTGGLSYLTDTDLQNQSFASGIPLEQLTAIQTAQKANSATVDAYVKGIESGMMGIENITDSRTRDLVVQKVDWDKVYKARQPEIVEAEFTSQERRRLEAAGLLRSTREEQLEFLYGGQQFLTKEWLLENFGRDALIEAMKKEGKTSIWKTRDKELEEYLDYLMNAIEAYRKTGKTDRDILKSMQ